MRIEYIDKLKGLAITAVVVGHVVGKSMGVGSSLNAFCDSFHMPLFMFLSGVFAYKGLRAYSWGEAATFVRKKALRVLWPFFIVGGLYVFAVAHQGGDTAGAWGGYWFLPALFYCMLAGLAVRYAAHAMGRINGIGKFTPPPHLRKA